VLYERRDIPLPILAYIPIFNEDETEDPADRGEMARIYLESVTVAPTMPEISAGDDAKVTLTLAVGAKPKILVVEEA
jgi:ABC-type dipeptide/oligopeptide/nickel transport system ATPase subunit